MMDRPPFYIEQHGYVYIRQPYHHPSMRDDKLQKAFAEKDKRIAELEEATKTVSAYSRRQERKIESLQARLDAVEGIVEQWWESSMSDDVAMVAIKAALEQK